MTLSTLSWLVLTHFEAVHHAAFGYAILEDVRPHRELLFSIGHRQTN